MNNSSIITDQLLLTLGGYNMEINYSFHINLLLLESNK